MNRTAWLAVVMVGLGGAMFAIATLRPKPAGLPCAPGEVHLGPDGVAHCGPGQALSFAQKLTLGVRVDLNQVTADELAQVPGVGPTLARELVAERQRLGRFRSWEQVDRVNGVGLSRLQALQAVLEIK